MKKNLILTDAKLNPKKPESTKWHVLRFLSNLAEESSNLLTFDQIKQYVPDAMIEGNEKSDAYFMSIQHQLLEFVYPIFIRENVEDFIGYLENHASFCDATSGYDGNYQLLMTIAVIYTLQLIILVYNAKRMGERYLLRKK